MSMIVAGFRPGSLIHLPDDNVLNVEGWVPEGVYVRNVPEELTPDIVARLTAAGYSFAEDTSGNVLATSESHISELQRKADALCERVTKASAAGDMREYWTYEEAMRMASGALSDAIARANASAPAAV
jgi:hypothetical protein